MFNLIIIVLLFGILYSTEVCVATVFAVYIPSLMGVSLSEPNTSELSLQFALYGCTCIVECRVLWGELTTLWIFPLHTLCACYINYTMQT